jgi:hypothetical protein
MHLVGASGSFISGLEGMKRRGEYLKADSEDVRNLRLSPNPNKFKFKFTFRENWKFVRESL